ncbi:hypothetical protein B296_00049257 [Ensete ventricosum]|uniref:Uncharacterized protein n=1 Tax=Ensete ventricosum TaxID=4639 RepID=A0A426YIW8_ENSVE|nr:hypothetical protein B296_00049257 [Ensete ventricosum]
MVCSAWLVDSSCSNYIDLASNLGPGADRFENHAGVSHNDASDHEKDHVNGKAGEIFYEAQDSHISDFVAITFLTRYPDSRLLELVVTLYNFCPYVIQVHPGSISIDGTLGNMRLRDMSLGPDSQWSWLCDIHYFGTGTISVSGGIHSVYQGFTYRSIPVYRYFVDTGMVPVSDGMHCAYRPIY